MAINTQLSRYYGIELPLLQASGEVGSAEFSFDDLTELYDRITKFQLEQLNLKSYRHIVIRVSDFNQSLHFQVSREKLSGLFCESLLTTFFYRKTEMKWTGQPFICELIACINMSQSRQEGERENKEEINDCQGEVMVTDSFNGHSTSLWSISFFSRPPGYGVNYYHNSEKSIIKKRN